MREIWEGIVFWVDCLVRGANFGGGVFGLAEIACALLWLTYRTKKQTKAAKDREERVREICKIAFLVLLGVTTVIVAPYQKYREAKTANRASPITEFAYQSLTNQVASAKGEAEKERDGRIKTEKDRDEWRTRAIDWAATNSSAAQEDLSEAIAIVKRESANIEPSNRETIKKALQYKKEIGSLEQNKEFRARVETFRPLYTWLRYAASEGSTLISERAKKCGGTLKPIALPSIDDCCRRGEEVNDIVSGSNCAWSASYSVNDQAGLHIRLTGKKSSSLARIYSKESSLACSLSVGDLEFARTGTITNIVNCVSNINWLLNFLIEAQEEVQ